MAQGALLDLVCGPASPLPETYQRYRLVAHIGSGGQADVYRAVRLCGGVTSAPLTVKVFRVDPHRPLVDELRSWDKGDAALMDLNNRGVLAICRRADGFYGPPPHRPGERAAAGDNVPYQVYDYLHGINLREYVSQRAGLAPGARRLNALTALKTLSGVLRELHFPRDGGATPVLHMDVKPSNLMVLTNGDVRLIDFTGARYWREEEITQIAYTPESGGPEAFGGVKYVGPAYDVHGFGAVAYYLVTGAYPRVSGSSGWGGAAGAGREGGGAVKHGDASPPPWNVLRKHPMLESYPALRDHLHAPLADRPGDRPDTRELGKWVAELGELVRRSRIEDVGVDWREADAGESGRAVGRARPAVTGTETGAYQRIEQLERELVALRGSSSPPPPPPAPLPAAPTKVNGAAAPQMMGRAKVMPRPQPEPTGVVVDPIEPRRNSYQPMRGERARTLKIGWEITGTGAFIAFICWGLWAADSKGTLTGPVVAFVIVLAVAAGVFALTRLLGRLILEQRLGRPRFTAKGAHALTGLFLAGAGIAYLRQVDWVMSAWSWLGGHLW